MRRISILLVEDNPLHIKLIGKMLEDIDHQLISAGTIREGCEEIKKNNFDVILLDLNLPDSAEKETFEKIDQCGNHIPVILITGMEDDELALTLIRRGAQDYITKKELNPVLLKKSIFYAIERHSLIRNIKEQQEWIASIEKERAEINTALLNSRENLFRFVSEAPFGIRIVSEEGDTNYANKALLDIYDFQDLEELIATPVEKRYTSESLEEHKARRARRRQEGEHEPVKYEIDIIKKSGEIRHLLVYRQKILWDDKMQYQVLYENITERKKAVKEIQQKNEQLNETIAEKNKFFSILAHDLKGPLGTFISATRFLKEGFHEMELEDIKEMIDSMDSSALVVYNLLETLLNWYRYKKDGAEITPKRINLKGTVETCAGTYREQIEEKEIALNLVLPETEIVVDSFMFETIIRNLLSNAVKFTPRRGNIRIAARNINDQFVDIEISDSGIGIPDELKQKLFQINEKTNRRGTEGEPGTGLGLLLCKEFVEKHRGSITVKSEAGKGSAFSVLFPINLPLNKEKNGKNLNN